MKRFMTSLLALGFVLLAATTSFAYTLRTPQLVFTDGPLQAYLNSVGETITVTAMQADVQVWSTNVTGNSDFTLTMKNGASVEIGMYNPNTPAVPYPVFPAAATDGWFAQVHFGASFVTVTLFDDNAVIQGQSLYLGLDKNYFGFTITSPSGTFYSQDMLNVQPMVLTFAGITNPGDWWLCFQATPDLVANSTFDAAVINIQSVRPTPTTNTTFGRIKSLYR